MTTSTRGVTPTYDSEGYQTWKPSVGVTFNKAGDTSNSYAGVITALQEGIKADGGIPKAYPHNFAGIIAAIKDLETAQDGGPPVTIQPIPPGSIIDGDGNLDIIIQPEDGELWFDSRQGRLFVAAEKEWWQTNGADGLAYVRNTDNPPPNDEILPGQFWYNPNDNDLYVYNGTDWVLIADGTDAGAFQTTATLPLASSGPRSNIGAYTGEIIPTPDLLDFNTQQDYNWWAFDAIVALEKELTDLAPVIVGDIPPAVPVAGQLWYDTETLDMSIWYEDGDSGQWAPVSAAYTYDEDLDTIRRDLSEETRAREINVQQLYAAISDIDVSNQPVITALQSSLENLTNTVTNINSTIDFSPYATKTELAQDIADVHDVINASIASTAALIPDVSGFALANSVNVSINNLANSIATKTTEAAVATQVDSILNAGQYLQKSYLDNQLSTLSTNYLTHSGGTLTGSLTVNKTSSDLPALDFSSNPSAGKPAFKFQTVSADSVTYSTFGTTDKFYEYAWKFEDKEDFCWVYADTNKVFSITKDGPACSQLYLADFGDNGVHGRSLHNKIDVRDRLTKYQTAFETMRQGVTNATDFDSLKANILTALASV